MTIPINAPNIQPGELVPSDVEMFLQHVLQGSEIGQRQQALDTEKERLRQEKQRHTDAQAEHDKEKANLAQLGEVARSLLLSMQPPTILPQGSIPFGAGAMTQLNVGAQSPFADLVRGLPAESVTQMLPLLQQFSTLQGTDLKNAGQGLSNTGQALSNQQAATTAADDQAIDRIVSTLETGPINRASIARVVTKVAAINPGKAAQLASSLGGLLPGFTPHINDDGSVAWVTTEPGGVVGKVQAKSGDVDQRKAGGYARRILEANATMTTIEKRWPGLAQNIDDWIRAGRASGQIPVGGKTIETVLTPQFLRTHAVKDGVPEGTIRQYINSRYDLANAILRRETGATINFEELDREIVPYVPMFRMTEDAVPSIQQRRLSLGLQYVDQAGPEFKPERLSPLARKYLLRAMSVTQDPGPDPDETGTLRVLPGTTVRQR